MKLFTTRESSIESLNTDLETQGNAIELLFELLDESIARLESVDSSFARVSGLTAIKGRNLSLGIFSLALDGLAQESGALLRPFIEVIELLVYLRLDPLRVDEAIDGKLPKAGIIAKKIEGKYQDLRGYLNDHASHFGFTYESLHHSLDINDFSWRLVQPYQGNVLFRNLGTLFLFMVQLTIEVFNCSSIAHKLEDDNLANMIKEARESGIREFFPDEQIHE
jgi:hypothetical protein